MGQHSKERTDLICDKVDNYRQTMHVSKLEAAEYTARDLGLSVSTVKRYLRRARAQEIHGTVTIERKYTVLPPLRPTNKPITVLAIGDTHDDPRLSPDRFRWIGRLAATTKPQAIVQIGDLATLDSLCRYDGNDTYKGKQKPLFTEDLAHLDLALGMFNDGLGTFKPAIKHVTLGNHEDRIETFSDRHPEIYGMMSRDFFQVLDKHGWTYSEFGKIIFIAGVGFVHVPLNGMGRPYGGETAELRIANASTHDLVMGHSHRNRVHTAPKVGDNAFVRVVNLGSALPDGHVEAYAKHSASGWSYGVYLLTLRDAHISDWTFISMKELEQRYG